MNEQQPSEIADRLALDRRREKLGSVLSALRVVFVLVVQVFLLLGFALLFVRPPSAAFYVAIFTLCVNAVLLASSLALFRVIRKRMQSS